MFLLIQDSQTSRDPSMEKTNNTTLKGKKDKDKENKENKKEEKDKEKDKENQTLSTSVINKKGALLWFSTRE